MARRNDGILDLLALLPWWVSVLTAGVVYVALAHVAPAITTTNPLLQGLLNAAPGLAPLFGIVLLIPAPISAFNAWRKRRLLDEQEDIASIRSLSWKQFEELVAEAYRRQGFRVVENTSGGADGGVDIRLVKNGPPRSMQAVAIEQGRRQHCPRDVRRNDGTEGGLGHHRDLGALHARSAGLCSRQTHPAGRRPPAGRSHRPGARGATGARRDPQKGGSGETLPALWQ